MAIYDIDATPSTAVTAWLSQFKVAAGGAITFVSGTDTFHVYWIHRALQKIAYDYATSGDDEINLSFPNPSKSEALGKIITLFNHTTDYTINYEVNDAVMEYHFGGSVSINDGDDVYYGLQIVGKTDGTVPIKVLQDHVELTSHWGNGKNQTDGNTLARIMVKGTSAGVDIDNKLVHVKLSKWGYEYSIWGTTLGLGESIASVTANEDPQNTTLLATVQAYDVVANEGYQLIDLDGNGTKPYLGRWDWGTAGNKKAIYEFVKSLLTDGTTDTLYGVDGDLWTGRLYDMTIGSGAGTWVQNETISWGTGDTAGTGNLVAVDNLAGGSTARLVLHLNSGVAPTDAMEITGAGAATGTTNSTPTALDTNPNHTGVFTGAWIGAYGIGFTNTQVTSADSFKSLNGDTVKPPNNVPISGTITCVNSLDVPHVFLAVKQSGVSKPEYDTYACAGNTSGAGVIDVDAIASDVPQTGYIGVLRNGTTTREYYEYDSWSGTTFNLVGTLAGDILATDPAHHCFFYQAPVGGGTVKSVSSALIYNDTPIDVIGWVRQGDESAPDGWQPIAGQIGSGGFSFSVTLTREG